MFEGFVFGLEVTSSTLTFHTGSKFSQILVQMVSIHLAIKAEMMSAGLENRPGSVIADN